MQEQPPLQPRILLAEDDLALRKMLRLNFEKEGWFVLEAPNGEEALRLARQNRLDAAVLDVMMPKLDGLAVCRSLRLEGIFSGCTLTSGTRGDQSIGCGREYGREGATAFC